MWKKVKKFFVGAWVKIKADLQKNLQATKAFIWANEVIWKAAEWFRGKMGDLISWTEKRVSEWQLIEKTLLAEQEKRRVELLKQRRERLLSELAKLKSLIPEEKEVKKTS